MEEIHFLILDGVKMEDVICDENCSPDWQQDEQETWRWIKHVLPQLRNKQVRYTQMVF